LVFNNVNIPHICFNPQNIFNSFIRRKISWLDIYKYYLGKWHRFLNSVNKVFGSFLSYVSFVSF